MHFIHDYYGMLVEDKGTMQLPALCAAFYFRDSDNSKLMFVGIPIIPLTLVGASDV